MSNNKRTVMSTQDIELPIQPDFTGMHTATLANERINVVLGEDRTNGEVIIES